MSMQQWDKHVAPILRTMEYNAKHLDYHSRNISDAVFLLPARPGFETRAEAELRQVEADLLAAIERVQTALRAYETKPVEGADHLQAAE